jgi:hypothetical protein
MKTVRPVIASNGATRLQIGFVRSDSTSEMEKQGTEGYYCLAHVSYLRNPLYCHMRVVL